MKKAFLILGAVLLIAAVIFCALGLFFRHAALSVMDAPTGLIARLFTAGRVFLLLGIGLALPGAAVLAAGIAGKAR